MNIIEEFIERKKLKNIPAIHHCIDGLIMARQSNPSLDHSKQYDYGSLASCLSSNYYVYMIVRWNEKPRGPGSYCIQFSSPIKLGDNYKACIRHSDSLNRSFVFKSLFSKTVEYDEFESTMLNWIESFANSDNKWILASTKDEAYFMLWESFVYMFDRYFAELPSHIKSTLWESTNEKNDNFSRKAAIMSLINYIDGDCKSVADLWTRDFVLMNHGFCDWISSIPYGKKIK